MTDPLSQIVATWAACRRCPLAETRRSVVVGEPWTDGDTDGAPLILIIGEAPGQREDELGRPFVGKSGEVLRNDVLIPAGVRLAYITNTIACRPPKNRDPEQAEIVACSDRLAQIVEALAPDGLLVVGRIAEAALDSTVAWSSAGRVLPRAQITHPAALLRRGYPHAEEARRALAIQIAKVRRLVERLGGAPASARPAQAQGEEAPAPTRAAAPARACEHPERVRVGAWILPTGSAAPMDACLRCGRVSDIVPVRP